MNGLGCVVAFLLPFAGIGLFAAVRAIVAGSAGDWGQAGFLAIFALVFGGVGIGGIAAALAGRRKLAEHAARRARHPDAPWLWRADWAAGRIEDSNRVGMWAAWIMAVFWNLISLPAAWMALRSALEEGERTALVALVFPLVGLGLVVWAVRTTLRYRRFGVSVLELQTIPGVVGRSIAGVVRTTSLLPPADGFRVVLTSLRRVTRGSGKNRSTSETILWQEERRVRGEAGRSAEGMTTSVPFSFPLPSDAAASDDTDSRDRRLWRLLVEASVPGVDYESTFEVPVFRTAQTAAHEVIEPPTDYRQPPESRIRVTTNRRGTEIHFPAARNPGAAMGATLFLVIWTGAIALMATLGAPTLFVIVFGLFELLILWGVAGLWFRVTRVAADADGVVVASGYLVPGRERRFAGSEIADVKTRIGMQTGGTPYYDLTLVRTDGRTVTAGRGIRDKREAEWLAATLRETLQPSR